MHRLQLLGGASVATPTGPMAGRAAQRHRLALLAFLAVGRSAGVSRDRLIAYLWPDADQERGRRLLSDSVYRINQAVGGDAVVATGDELRLDPSVLPSDVGDFEDAVGRGDADQAVAAYAGPLLDGFFVPDAPEFERWVDGERDRLARAFASSLEMLAVRAEQTGDRRGAVEWWRRLAGQDPFNSRVAVRLMQALDAAGERAAALQHARVHETLLKEEFGAEPDPSVSALAERLRSAAATRAAEARVVSPRAAPLPHETTPEPATIPEQDATVVHTSAPGGRWTTRARWLIAAVVLLGVAAVVSTRVRSGRSAAAAASAAPAASVAVLPFANLSAESENEYFADGMTEELISMLSQLEGLRVPSRTSVFVYKGKSADVREVGQRLGVATVVEGSVRREGKKLRITAQLVSTTDGYHLWSATYDRELNDVFAIQEEISRAIVDALSGTLVKPQSVAHADRPTVTADAYDLYLKGRYAWHQRNEQGLRDAVAYFNGAVAAAPDYARAFVGLGDAYAVNAFYDYLAPRDAYPKAEAAARRALAIDSTLGAPHATLGYIATYYHWDWPRAEGEFKRAIAIDSESSTAHQWYANLLTVAGRFDEAEREFRLAQQAEPLSLIANAALGWSYYLARKFDRALEQCRQTLELNANFELAHLWSGLSLERLGRHDEALAAVGRARTLSHESVLTTLALAQVLASAGRRDSARSLLAAIERREGERYLPSYEIAIVRLALGDRAGALTRLERAYQDRAHSIAYLRVDPSLDPLRGDPRFEALVRRAGAR